MYQFSDSDSSDSEDGIRFKTDSTRNKDTNRSSSSRHRRSHQSRHRSRSRSYSPRRTHKHKKHKKSSRRSETPERDRRRHRRDSPDRKKSVRSESSEMRRSKISPKRKRSESVELKKNEIACGSRKNSVPEITSQQVRSIPRKIAPSNETNNILSKLQNLNRVIVEDVGPKSPFTKKIESDSSSSNHDVGPTLPLNEEILLQTNDLVGPVLPKQIADKDCDSLSSSNDSSMDKQDGFMGPALPPHLQNDVGPSIPLPIENDVVGPSLPIDKNQLKDDVIEPSLSSDLVGPSLRNDVVGPSLPPHLKDDVGTSLPPHLKDVVGPSLPPHLSKDDIVGPSLPSEDEDNVVGPLLPPHLHKNNDNDSEKLLQSEEINAEKYIGPSLPAHLRKQLEEQATKVDNKHDDEEDNEDYGPLPPELMTKSKAHLALEERALQMRIDKLNPAGEEKAGREEWMLELPTVQASNLGLGPRQFRAKAGPDLSDRSSWTDTPEEKNKKKVEPQLDIKKEAELLEIQKRDLEQEEMSKKHKKKKKSLLEDHQDKLKAKKQKEDKDGNVRRPFNRDIDLKVNQFDEAQKKAIYKKAQLLDDRFSKGQSKYL